MSWARLEAEGGLQWPCPDADHPGSPFLHEWLWDDDLGGRDPAPFSVVEAAGALDELSADYPLRLTTGRVLDSFNTGVQSGALPRPTRQGAAVEISPDDAVALGVVEGDRVRITSRRGSADATIAVDSGLPAGLVFATFHFPELLDVNRLTNDAWDPRSGTAEFKAAAVRVEALGSGEATHG